MLQAKNVETDVEESTGNEDKRDSMATRGNDEFHAVDFVLRPFTLILLIISIF